MSLNFYGRIKEYKNGDKNITITILTGNLTDSQLIALNTLKDDDVVNFVAEDATLKYTEDVDIETGDAKYQYYTDIDGVWKRKEIEQTGLDLDGQPNYEERSREITADVVDDFILSNKIEYDAFDIVKVLSGIVEGYTFDDLAKERNISVTELVSKINEARDYFAPFAMAWQESKEED